MPSTCMVCSGTGTVMCRKCNGSGRMDHPAGYGETTCDACEGEREIDCQRCDGTGERELLTQ